MGENTKIEWTATTLPDGTVLPGFTFNSWTGCTKVSPACDNCYAESWAKRSGIVQWGNHPRRRTSESYWKQPLKWNRIAERDGIRRKVFCCSLADVFDNQVPEEWRHDLFALIDSTPWLDWLLLTKRPQNIAKLMPRHIVATWDIGIRDWADTEMMRPNVWLGTTVENQEEADRRIPHLIRVPAAVHFLSCEPLLGDIDLEYPKGLYPNGPPMCCSGFDCGCMGQPVEPPIIWYLKWVIVGGESGPNRRHMDLAWARGIRDQCANSGTAFFGKQDDKIKPLPQDLMIRQFPEPCA
jgi:protein gp37